MNTVQGLKTASLMPLVWSLGVLLLFTIGESAGGDLSGLGHLFPVLLICVLMWVGWRWPLWGGSLLIVAGLLSALRFAPTFQGSAWVGPVVIYIAPLLLAGLLFLAAARLERNAL